MTIKVDLVLWSNRLIFTNFVWLVSSVGRAEDWKSSCPWFDSETSQIFYAKPEWNKSKWWILIYVTVDRRRFKSLICQEQMRIFMISLLASSRSNRFAYALSENPFRLFSPQGCFNFLKLVPRSRKFRRRQSETSQIFL